MTSSEYKIVTDLLVRFRRGDREAFSQVYSLYEQKVYFLCCKLVKSTDDGAKLSSDIFDTVYLKLSSFSDGAVFENWLFCECNSRCKSFLQRTDPSVFLDYTDTLSSEGDNIENIINRDLNMPFEKKDIPVTNVNIDDIYTPENTYDTENQREFTFNGENVTRPKREIEEPTGETTSEIYNFNVPSSMNIDVNIMQTVDKILSDMPQRLRVAVLLKYFCGMDTMQIAQAESIAIQNANNRLYKARIRLLTEEHKFSELGIRIQGLVSFMPQILENMSTSIVVPRVVAANVTDATGIKCISTSDNHIVDIDDTPSTREVSAFATEPIVDNDRKQMSVGFKVLIGIVSALIVTAAVIAVVFAVKSNSGKGKVVTSEVEKSTTRFEITTKPTQPVEEVENIEPITEVDETETQPTTQPTTAPTTRQSADDEGEQHNQNHNPNEHNGDEPNIYDPNNP